MSHTIPWFPIFIVLFGGTLIVVWFLLYKANPASPETAPRKPLDSWLDNTIILLCFIGIIGWPNMLRSPVVNSVAKGYGNLNFFCAAAMLLTLFRLPRRSREELICFAAWLLLLIPMLISGRDAKTPRKVVSVVQNLLPLFLVLHSMRPASRRKVTGLFLVLFDVFIGVLLTCAIVEQFTGHAIAKAMVSLIESGGGDASSFDDILSHSRFYFIWGHPLTNALSFNTFFALNVIWLRANKKRCFTFLFFIPTVVGVLLTYSRTGLTVCVLLMIIMNWKHKKSLLAAIPVLAVLYFAGVFNGVIERISTLTLTDGRLEHMQTYLASGVHPLRFLTGYGPNTVLNRSGPLYSMRFAFEFPLMMYAHDYGILFSFVHLFGLFGFVTWRFLRKKGGKRNWFPWLCWSLLFAEINTYNAYTLNSHDVCWFFCLITMILLNTVEIKDPETTPPIPGPIPDPVSDPLPPNHA